jgi:NAD(P)H-hydrate epimerase
MVKAFLEADLKKLYVPAADSHKGQNGKLMIIGGSKLFHAASLWALKVASRIVDMVYYSSVDENNQIAQKAKEEFRDGIVVKRSDIDSYIQEADCVLIGPGLPRPEGQEPGDDDTKELTERLLKKYPNKKWVIDGGSLQTMNPMFIAPNAILTPHQKEFEKLFRVSEDRGQRTEDSMRKTEDRNLSSVASAISHLSSVVSHLAKEYNCTILLKGHTDIVCSSKECVKVEGGNAGMTKGGTGDVLAGLVAALYCKNDAFLSACAGSYINKKAGQQLFERVGYYFNASDLADEIPKVMKKWL